MRPLCGSQPTTPGTTTTPAQGDLQGKPFTISYATTEQSTTVVTTQISHPPPRTTKWKRGSGKRVTAVIAWGKRPVPFRTRKLRPTAPMVLHPRECGRVGHRRTTLKERPHQDGEAFPALTTPPTNTHYSSTMDSLFSHSDAGSTDREPDTHPRPRVGTRRCIGSSVRRFVGSSVASSRHQAIAADLVDGVSPLHQHQGGRTGRQLPRDACLGPELVVEPADVRSFSHPGLGQFPFNRTG